jgi:DNA-binding transcriptional regulator YdaS (Cro superfamily)
MEQEITPFEALKLAVKLAHGQSGLGRICGVGQPAVWKWLQSSKRLPAEHVLPVEAETGVSRHLLRPDIYPRENPSLHASCVSEPVPLCGPVISALKRGGHGKSRANLDNAA